MTPREPTSPLFPREKKTKFLSKKFFLPPFLQKKIEWKVSSGNLDGEEDIRVLGLPQSVKEEGKVVVVVQGLKRHLKKRFNISEILAKFNFLETGESFTFQLILFPRPSCFSAMGKSPLVQILIAICIEHCFANMIRMVQY